MLAFSNEDIISMNCPLIVLLLSRRTDERTNNVRSSPRTDVRSRSGFDAAGRQLHARFGEYTAAQHLPGRGLWKTLPASVRAAMQSATRSSRPAFVASPRRCTTKRRKWLPLSACSRAGRRPPVVVGQSSPPAARYGVPRAGLRAVASKPPPDSSIQRASRFRHRSNCGRFCASPVRLTVSPGSRARSKRNSGSPGRR